MAKNLRAYGDSQLTVTEMRQALAQNLAAHTPAEGAHQTAVSGLVLYRHTAPSACYPTTCVPSLTIFLQGRKLINLGGTEYLCDGSSFLLSSIEAPVQSQIIEASKATPFLALRLLLDMTAVQEILSREDLSSPVSRPANSTSRASAEQHPSRQRGLAVGETTAGLLTAAGRLLELLDCPEDIPFLAPLIQREIIYRILKTPQGERLRAIATRGDLSNRTVKAMAWLRAHYTKPLRIEELARIAQMGISTFHHQFRALTAMSPLQYQKQLRLQAARQLMLTDGIDATQAAYEVGYKSVSQFSREYRRFFGQPPRQDVRTLRSVDSSNTNSTTGFPTRRFLR